MNGLLALGDNAIIVDGKGITCASAGTDTSDATITSGAQILYPYTGYANGLKYEGSIQSKSAQTYIPTTTNQTIESGQYLSGTQTILGDANLIASNIKKDVVLFDDTDGEIVGTYEPKNTQIYFGTGSTTSTSYTALTNVKITVAKTGTYKVYFLVWKGNNSTSSTGQLYKNGSALSLTKVTKGNYGEVWYNNSMSLTANDVLQVYVKSSSTSYTTYGGYIIIQEV